MARRSSSHSKLASVGRILYSDGASYYASVMIFGFIFLCIFGMIGMSYQSKTMDAEYQKIFSEANFSIPRNIDEAASWMIIAEDVAYNYNNHLRDYQDGEQYPPTYSETYGWKLVTHSHCTEESAAIQIEYIVGTEVVESLDIPVTLNDTSRWVGSVETKAVRFETYCNPYADRVYFSTEMYFK